MVHTSARTETIPNLRALVSAALTQEGLSKLADLLKSFRSRYPHGFGDIARFEFLLDEMFDVFLSLNVESTAKGEVVNCFPLQDNFDTGNGSAEPFPLFVEGVQEAFRDLDSYRGYFGPRPIDGLSEAVKGWLVRQGFITAARSLELAVAVGAGTVHLYDVLCRTLIQRSGDSIIIPEVTYGFFVPQVERNGGRVQILRASGGQKITAADAEDLVNKTNTAAVVEWRKTIRQRLDIYISEIENHFREMVCSPTNTIRAHLCNEVAVSTSPLEIQAWMERFVRAEVCRDEELCQRILKMPALRRHFPPRVVAYLHINPNLFGKVYEPAEVELLTQTLAARDVTVIEDVAYHSLGRSIGSFKSSLCFGSNVFSLIGVSKPLSIPNCRLGLLLGERGEMTGLYRLIENSVGFISTLLQRGLVRAFSEPETLDLYLTANWSDPDGYQQKKNLMLACLEGCTSSKIDSNSSDTCRQRVRDGVVDFFEWKRSQGIELFDADFRFTDGHLASDPADFRRRIQDCFVEEGLSRWLDVCAVPECGFFVIADCRRLLQRLGNREPYLTCAFDVFALLAVLFGVRTIPEECMGDLEFSGSHRLRFSYSVPNETITRATITLYLGLKQLEAQVGSRPQIINSEA